MKTFFMTFAQSHPLKNKYVGIVAPDYEQARAGAFRTFGKNFAFIYDANDSNSGLDGQIMDFGISPAFHFRSVTDQYATHPYTDFIDESAFQQAKILQHMDSEAA